MAMAASDDEWLDAIADAVIFIADYCSAMGWDLQALWDHREAAGFGLLETAEATLACVGKLQHHHLKAEQGIRGSREHHEAEGKRWLGALLYELDENLADGELLVAVERTWRQVQQRDWVAHRKAAS